jgi:ATP-binding cassette, subfamily B, bacterial
MRRRFNLLFRPLLPTSGAEGIPLAPTVTFRTIVRRFWPYARPYRRWLAATLALTIIIPLIDTLTIWMFKLVVDDVLVPRDLSAFVWIAPAYLALTLAGGILVFADTYVSTLVSERFILALRAAFFRHVQGLSLDFFDRKKLGDLLSRLTADTSQIETFMLSGAMDALAYIVRILFFTSALFYVSWRLALASLVVLPVCGLLTRRFSRLVKQASRERRRRSGAISAVAEESLANAALVQAYNRQDEQVERFHREGMGSLQAQLRASWLSTLFAPLIDLIKLSGLLIVFVIGTLELSAGRISLGGLLVFLTYLNQLYSPVRRLGRLSNTIFSASASAERIIEFLDVEPSVKDSPRARAFSSPAKGHVTLDNVTFGYPGSVQNALGDVSFDVRPGRSIALVGPAGAGKSTVAKLIMRFYDPVDGTILLDGTPLTEIQLHSLRDQMGVLLQETLVFDGTIRDNIAFGKPGASQRDIVNAAKEADAHDFVMTLPERYDTVIGQKGRRLSGGQRQRVAIARAMVRDSPLLILDEPTAGLDVESADRVVLPLRRLMSGRTTITISHNLMTVTDVDEIVVLDHGRVVERGAHDELLADGGLYARLFLRHRAFLDRAADGAAVRSRR